MTESEISRLKRNVQRFPCFASKQQTDESLQTSILTRNEVCLHICTWSFGQTSQMTFFDLRFFNKNIKRYVNQDI